MAVADHTERLYHDQSADASRLKMASRRVVASPTTLYNEGKSEEKETGKSTFSSSIIREVRTIRGVPACLP